MIQLNDLASRLLRIEQQLVAYQKLHADELAELWRTLNECKREITVALSDQGPCEYANGSSSTGVVNGERHEPGDESDEGLLNSTSRSKDQRR